MLSSTSFVVTEPYTFSGLQHGLTDPQLPACRLESGHCVDHGVRLENGIYGHSRFCNTDFDDKLACLNLSGV
ncbi:hypothetical protein FD815_29670 [Klebsiella pneumoniae]|jgi:hypothetical protein|nr:hypothetical protein [Salmonella enterica]MBK2436960.1 hypothetical protein [Klebsiella pneumoniae]MDI4505542.1 hypothetical protein [Escherichia coli]TRL54812.1 hypothetical protein FMV79_25385 [Enterobacter hormaechei]EBT4783346.1 hypothetical protein [Salmonella enterica]